MHNHVLLKEYRRSVRIFASWSVSTTAGGHHHHHYLVMSLRTNADKTGQLNMIGMIGNFIRLWLHRASALTLVMAHVDLYLENPHQASASYPFSSMDASDNSETRSDQGLKLVLCSFVFPSFHIHSSARIYYTKAENFGQNNYIHQYFYHCWW